MPRGRIEIKKREPTPETPTPTVEPTPTLQIVTEPAPTPKKPPLQGPITIISPTPTPTVQPTPIIVKEPITPTIVSRPAPTRKPEYVAPTPQVILEPPPSPREPALVEKLPTVGPLAGRIGYVAQPTTKEEAIEREIMSVYAEAPIATQLATTIQRGARPGAPISVKVYAPTPKQEEKIVGLAEQLPPETRAKYLTGEPVKEEPKGLGEILAGISIQPAIAQVTSWITGTPVESIEEYQKIQKKTMVAPSLRPVEPIKEVGGIIASVEAPVYTVGRMVGLETPRPPPTVSSGLIGAALGDPRELEQVKEYGPEYARGTILGDVAVSFAVGKGAEKAWVVAKKVTPEFIKHPIYQTVKFGRVAKVAHKIKVALPSFKGSRVDVFLAKHSKSYYKATHGIAYGEVGLPPITEPISLGQLKASKLAWEMTRAPRTGGVWLSRLGVAPTKTQALPHLISIGGKVSIGYLREIPRVPTEEPYWRRGLLPFVTQTQQTRLGLIPYIPKMASITGKKGVGFGVGFALTAPLKIVSPTKIVTVPHVPKLVTITREKEAKVAPALVAPLKIQGPQQIITVPKLVAPPILKLEPKKKMVVTPKFWQPTLAYEREKFRPLTLLGPKVKQRDRLAPILKLQQVLEQPQVPTFDVPTPDVPILRVPPYIPTPTVPPSQVPSPFFPYIPRGGHDISRGARGLFGKWFKREHAIATPQQVAYGLFGETKPRRKKKRKRKRKGKRRRKRTLRFVL